MLMAEVYEGSAIRTAMAKYAVDETPIFSLSHFKAQTRCGLKTHGCSNRSRQAPVSWFPSMTIEEST